jgi:hypothetical protein
MSRDFAASNPMRVPSWRWLRSGQAADTGPPLSRTRDDAWVSRACRYRREERRCNDEIDRDLLAERFPELYWAHHFFSTTAKDSVAHRSELEARILSGQEFEAIAEKIGTSTGVVAAYAQLFFDVTARLKHTGYIFHHVIGSKIQTGVSEDDYSTLWKLFGFLGGPLVVDALVSTAMSPDRPVTAMAVPDFFDSRVSDSLRRKAAIAAHSLTVKDEGKVQALGLFLRLIDQEHANADDPTARNAVLVNINAMLELMPLETGAPEHAPVTVFDSLSFPKIPAFAPEVQS